MINVNSISSIESEAGVIASLILNPDLYYYSEELKPSHFVNEENKVIYEAIINLMSQNIVIVDAYNVTQSIKSLNVERKVKLELSIEQINDFIENALLIARSSVEEYKLLVNNILDCAFRRDLSKCLVESQSLCYNLASKDIEQLVYKKIDTLMSEYTNAGDVPPISETIDDYWEEIKERQKSGYSGIQFPFPTLNEYATIEKGELFIFAAEQKQGKSMMLLNCALSLMRKNIPVLYLDSELNSRLFTARILSRITGIEYKKLTAGKYTEEEEHSILRAKDWLKTRKFTHIYIPLFDEKSIYAAVKKVKHTQGVEVLIVDYFKGRGDGDAFDTYQELGRFVDIDLTVSSYRKVG